MSTRATIHFHWAKGDKPAAIIYRHSDGYPEGLGACLLEFVKEVRENVKDNRFTDASYLAAKWVVYDASRHARDYGYVGGKFAQKPTHPLNFLSVGIVNEDPGDIEYRYHVVCDGVPTITCETAKGEPVTMPVLPTEAAV